MAQPELFLAADQVEQAIDSNLDHQFYSQVILEDLKYVDERLEAQQSLGGGGRRELPPR